VCSLQPRRGDGSSSLPPPSVEGALSRHSGTGRRNDRRSRSPQRAYLTIGERNHPCGRDVARCHRWISADRGGALAPFLAAPARGGGRRGEAHPDSHLRRTAPSVRRMGGGGGGLAWGSCGRSGRHALGRAAGASCVQRLDDSRNSAIHTTYRISLRSSSLQEPRYPLLRVVCLHICGSRREPLQSMI
jgi:hypothetical protein